MAGLCVVHFSRIQPCLQFSHLLVICPDGVLGEALHRVQEAEEAQQRVAVAGRQQVQEVLQVLELLSSP